MNDQAAALRALRREAPFEPQATPPGPPTIVIGSGRGGVGKSVVAVVLADTLAANGHRVLLLDGDQNLATLHVLLRVRPRGHLADLADGSGAAESLLTPVRERLWLLPGDSGAEALYGRGLTAQARLHARLSQLSDGFDAVIVDAASGLESAVRAATLRASQLVVVTVPEPAGLAGAYALIKIAYAQACTTGIAVIVNRARADDDGRAAFHKLEVAAERFLQRPLRFLGTVPEDEVVHTTLRAGRTFPDDAAHGPAVTALRAIALGMVPARPAMTA
jgi:MinD-like ATPase involved in chromosome partitioning or flagellar assembly